MKISETFKAVESTWAPIILSHGILSHKLEAEDAIKFFTPAGKRIKMTNFHRFYISPDHSRLALHLEKAYWAKGRKIRVESNLGTIPSGTYIITEKAESHSYDYEDYLIIKLDLSGLTTPRKTLNWLEKRVEELEARDGLTTKDLALRMFS